MTAASPRQAPDSRPARRTSKVGAKAPKFELIDRQADQARRRRRSLWVALSTLFVVGAMAVTTAQAALVQRQQDLDELRSDVAAAEASKARVERKVAEASAPHIVVERATELGMVRAESPTYIVAAETSEE